MMLFCPFSGTGERTMLDGRIRRTLSATAILCCVLFAGAAAWAVPPKYTKKETDVKATQTERTAPVRAKQEKQGPTLKSEQFSAGIQTKIADINEVIIR